MAKVTTFSRKFPNYHIRKQQPTLFVEKFLNSLEIDYKSDSYLSHLIDINAQKIASGKITTEQIVDFFDSLEDPVFEYKKHTMRQGFRYNQGEKFSPRVWSGRPYFSPQIILTEDIEIVALYDCVFIQSDIFLSINNFNYYPNGYDETIQKIAINDGLSVADFKSWFNKPFNGQIICWKNVEYK